MKFAKMENGVVRFCPKTGTDGQGRQHTNLPKYYETAEDRDGWMEVVETDKPDGAYTPKYTVQDGRIVQEWEPEQIPEPEPDPYQMRADIDYLAMMGDIDLGGDAV